MKTREELEKLPDYVLLDMAVAAFGTEVEPHPYSDAGLAAACLAEIDERGLQIEFTEKFSEPFLGYGYHTFRMLQAAATNPKAIIIAAILAAQSVDTKEPQP